MTMPWWETETRTNTYTETTAAWTPYTTWTTTSGTRTITAAGTDQSSGAQVAGPFIGMNGQTTRTVDVKNEVNWGENCIGYYDHTVDPVPVTCPEGTTEAYRMKTYPDTGGNLDLEFVGE
jgi:hypothetical protein